MGIQSASYDNITDFFFGPTCDDFSDFLQQDVSGHTLDEYLDAVKNKHTKVHDGLGGQGGVHARAVDSILQSQYNFTKEDIVVVVASSSKFLKKYVPQKGYYSSDVYPIYPLNCSADPYPSSLDVDVIGDDDGWVSTAEPGTDGGPSCACASSYFEDADSLSTLMSIYFDKYIRPSSAQYVTPARVMAMDFDDQVAVMKLLCSRLSYDGDMVGSASPIDPVFWVSHGAVEKLFQRIVLGGLLSNMDFAVDNECSGHAPWGTKAWLEGYSLMDASVAPTALTNSELIGIVDPSGEAYADLLPYVYDATPMGCDVVDTMLPI